MATARGGQVGLSQLGRASGHHLVAKYRNCRGMIRDASMISRNLCRHWVDKKLNP